MPFALYNHFLSDPCMSLRPMQNGKLDKQPRWSALELHILLLLRGKMLCLRLLWKLWLLSRCQVCAWPLPATVVYKRSISTFLGLSVLQFVVNHTWLGMNACVRTSHIFHHIHFNVFPCLNDSTQRFNQGASEGSRFLGRLYESKILKVSTATPCNTWSPSSIWTDFFERRLSAYRATLCAQMKARLV